MTASNAELGGFPRQTVVVVPAHNELAHLPRCLRALSTAALCLPTPVSTVVVLDSCDDGSERLAGDFGADVHFISVDAGNVGAARAAGFDYAKSANLWSSDTGAAPEDTWYATTDADSMVDADWLVRMVRPDLHGDAAMVLGVVRVPNWRHVSPAVVRRYLREYRSKGPDHDHVHGANMGFRADAYWHVGGFPALATGEDVELVQRFEAAGLSIHRDRRLSVATSARREGRAPGGFAQHLRGLSRSGRKSKAGAGT
ncbi:glycosyl transferase [Mycolicibacterium cyprinidarum]|uniref:4,4'-diaponeurosporenoate glycosyltransferase n=1 Tax=Mycolicibacterium cyprinidarum TaxID=2860311 RepID=A0ABQ4V8H1_9MYCO|nr:glycosyl transferase [Mycolicibacterium sp. NGTWS1803]GJF12962.1 glycosyl transferase [Mycolicibacterium sp. NGTWS0302]GJF13950.1 glycosyl transferase [Mycolicibacterium sp. NGTWSNA01]